MTTFGESPIQEIRSHLLTEQKVQLFIKRDDQLHPHISGNKWRKLKYNLQAAKAQKHTRLLTFGGAYSNHIAAVAAAGQAFDFQTIGVIRGEKVVPLNPTLAFVAQCGMELHFVRRTAYRQDKAGIADTLQRQIGSFYSLPEGGTNCLALKGCTEIVTETEKQLQGTPDFYCLCAGTGGTAAGVIAAAEQSQVIAFSVLKGDFLQREITALLQSCYDRSCSNWQLQTGYHFGGYAKFQPELLTFIHDFYQQHHIPLDPIYTGKLFYGIFDLVQQGFFPQGSRILAIHTGGLQGIAGFNQRHGNLLHIPSI